MSLKTGDKVRILPSPNHIWEGHTGRIVKQEFGYCRDKSGRYDFYVEIYGTNGEYADFDSNELEKID